MGDGLTVIQKFWCSACIIWLVFIFVTYRDHLHNSTWSAVIIVFVGFFPIIFFVISVARRKYQDILQYRPHNTNPQPIPILTQNMVVAGLIPPEPREPPRRSQLCNLSIDSLVTYMYQKDGSTEVNECVICLGQLQQGECVAKLQFCSHLFHEKCIDPWLRQHKTCPVCRSRVDRNANTESIV